MQGSLADLGRFVQEARGAGARGVEALFVDRQRRSLTARHRGSAPRRESGRETRLTVRAWLEGGRRGEATGDPADAEQLLARALEAAAHAPEDPWDGPVPRMEAPPRGLGVDDLRHDQLTDADRLEVVTTNLRGAAKPSAVTSATVWYAETREVRRFANSHGVALELPHTTYEAGGEVTVDTPDGPLVLRDHIAGRAFASIACLPFGQNLASRAEALLRPVIPLSGPVRVLLPPRATGRLVAWLAELFAVCDGEAARSFIARADGEPLFHRRLHLVDDGTLAGGLRTRGFDDRGVVPIPLTLLREGRVAARLIDPRTARRIDVRPTGHDWGGVLRPTNLQLNAGARSMNAWLGEQDRPVFEVDDLDDLDGIDPVTGDLDLVVHGVVWERQRPVGALRHARLRGNLVEALRQVAGIASDTDRILHVDAPGLFLDGLKLG